MHDVNSSPPNSAPRRTEPAGCGRTPNAPRNRKWSGWLGFRATSTGSISLVERILPASGRRSSPTPFDWNDRSTWGPALEGIGAAYVVYSPDLAVPAAGAAITAFTALATEEGVRRLVLLSGRGEEEAERCERIVRSSGLEWTIVRASWFAQNFDEGAFQELVLRGEVALPAGEVLEPFIDVDDIADIVVAALTTDGHVGEIYEVTGPRLMTFSEAIAEIAAETGRADLRYVTISREAFKVGLEASGLPAEQIELLDYLFTTVLDGRNAHVTDDVERALGRPARDFRDYARTAAASGVWTVRPQHVGSSGTHANGTTIQPE